MKQRILIAACAAAMVFSGCQPSTALLNRYSELDLLGSSDVLSLVDPQKADGFASDLAVVSVADNEAFVDDKTIVTPAALLIRTDTNEALYYKNIYEPLAPASLTKLMTALLVMEHGSLDEEITITQEMVDINNPEAQMAGFVPGDKISVRDMLYCMLVYSGNDTSNALAVYISGSVEKFAEQMNARARELGALHTNFVNACGLDVDGHLTCAYDLYLMFTECMKHEEFSDALSKASYTVNYMNSAGEAVSKTFDTTNLYFAGLYDPPEGVTVLGGKTGTTGNAGACLMLSVKDADGAPYTALVLGGSDKPELYQQMSNLLSIIQKK